MSSPSVYETVIRMIKKVATEQDLSSAERNITGADALVDDLGFRSLDVATLAALLERELKVDPFGTHAVSPTDVRTVQDLTAAYEKCLPLAGSTKASAEPDPNIEAALRRAARRRGG